MIVQTFKRFSERHRIACQVVLGLILAVGYNVLPTFSAPTPPTVYELRWYQQGSGATTTPPALEYKRSAATLVGGTGPAGAVAYPAPTNPGAVLNVTAAAEDSSKLTFQLELNTVLGPAVPGSVPTPRGDGKFQTARLSVQLPYGPGFPAEHQVRVKVTTNGGTSNYTPVITVLDPRVELARELSQLKTLSGASGYGTIADFLNEMSPVVERAQADFRIHYWGDNAERALQPESAYPAGLAPLLLEGREPLVLLPGSQPHDPLQVLLRQQPWVTGFGDPTAGDEASGEYFTALLNAESGRLKLDHYVDLRKAPATEPVTSPALPEVYQREGLPPGTGCFPRQGVDRFQIPDQLFLETALDALGAAPFTRLGVIPIVAPNTPADQELGYRDLADLGRLFNNQTANMWTPATIEMPADSPHGAKHSPLVPRVRVFAAIRDGVARPLVLWTFSDPKCGHNQAEVKINGPPVTPVSLGNGVYAHTLGSTTIPASVTVEVSDGTFWSLRKVQLQ